MGAPGVPGWTAGLGILLLLAACGRADFPFCCDLSGTNDVPVVKTYDFNFKSGFSTLSSPASNLTVATAADLANFLAAANLQQNTSTGTISGVLIDSAGTFIQGLRIGVFDDAGNPIKDFFYNSLGGVPDFSNTSGATDTTGSFSIFNAPPGLVHVRILHGGRGNARVLSFAGAISLMASQALPAVPDSVPITGVVNGVDTGAPVPGAQIFALGVNGLGVNGTIATSNSNGGYNIPEPRATASGFGPSLVSNGSYYMKISAAGYRTTYQIIATNPAAIQAGTTDLTQFFKLQSESELSKEAVSVGIPLSGSTTLLEGVIRETDGTPRPDTEIDLRDVDGNQVGEIYYRTDSAVPALDRLLVKKQPDGSVKTSNNGEFLVFFNSPPPSKVYLSTVSTLTSLDLSNPNKYSASREITLFPGSVSYVDPFIIPENALDDNDPSFIPSNSQVVTGKVLNISGNPIGDVDISVLGFFGSMGLSGGPSDGPGKYTLPSYSYFNPRDPKGPNYQCTIGPQCSQTIDDYRSQRKQYYPFPNDPDYPTLKTCTPSYHGTTLLTPTKKAPDCALVANAGYVLRLSPPVSSSDYFETYEKILLDNNHNGNLRNLVLPSRDELGGQAPTPGKGIVVGTLFIQGTIRTASGIKLAANDEQGNPIGDIYYFDDQNPPQIVQADQSFNNGRFAVANIPISNGEKRIFISVISSDDSGAASVRVQENAVTVSDLVVNKSPAFLSDVRGSVQDLEGTAIPGASGRVLGEKTAFASSSQSGSEGSYAVSVESFGSYIMRLEGPNFLSSENYQVRTGIGNTVKAPLYMTSLGELSTLSGGVFAQDPTLGVIAGKVSTPGFQPGSPSMCPGPPDCYVSITPRQVATGFFDSDDKVDIAVVGTDGSGGQVKLLLGFGDGTFKAMDNPVVDDLGDPILGLGTSGSDLRSVATADFNQDGLADLAVVDYGANPGSCTIAPDPCADPSAEPGIYILLSNGNGTFTPVENPISFAGSNTILGNGGVALRVLNYDTDDLFDLAVVNEINKNVFILKGAGDGTFTVLRVITNILPPQGFSTGDFNADGKTDIVLTTPTGIDVYLNGNEANRLSYQTDSPPIKVNVGDFDLDGRTDWAVLRNDGSSYVIDVIFNKPIATHLIIPISGYPLNPPSSLDLLVFDYDSDDRLDFLVTLPLIGQAAIFFGDGAGHFSSPVMHHLCTPDCTDFLTTALGFFDRDLFVDLVSVTSTQAYVSLGGLSPIPGVQVEATAMDGTPVGRTAYFGSSGGLDLSLDRTTLSGSAQGRFLIYNVPPGLKMVRAAAGGSGNIYIIAKAGELSYLELQTVQSPPEVVLVNGGVGDFVGNPIVDVQINFLGTTASAVSVDLGAYQLRLRGNSEYIVALDRPNP